MQGELYLAVLLCVPPDKQSLAAIERNLAKVGAGLDAEFVTKGLLSTRYPDLGLTLAEIYCRAAEDRMDLKFAVGTIRKAGENTAAEMARSAELGQQPLRAARLAAEAGIVCASSKDSRPARRASLLVLRHVVAVTMKPSWRTG